MTGVPDGGGHGRRYRFKYRSLRYLKTDQARGLSGDRYLNQLKMPQSAVEALARAVPDDVVRDIVRAGRSD